MLLTDPLLVVPAPAAKRESLAAPALRRLARAWREHRQLLDWNRDLQRPADCRHLPSRAWRRHSALLSLRSGARGPEL